MTRKEAINQLRLIPTITNKDAVAVEMAIRALEYKRELCPFCGSEKLKFTEPENSPDGWLHITCQSCFACLHFHIGEQTAIKKWNSRSSH